MASSLCDNCSQSCIQPFGCVLSCPHHAPRAEDRASVPLVFKTPAYSSDWFTKQQEQRQEYSRRRKLRELAGGQKASVEEIQEQYNSQAGRCFYCGCALDDKYHVDHYIPLCLGGRNDAGNIKIACPSCNRRKNGKHPAEVLVGNPKVSAAEGG